MKSSSGNTRDDVSSVIQGQNGGHFHQEQDVLSIHASEGSFQHQTGSDDQSSIKNNQEGNMSHSHQHYHRQDAVSINASGGSFQNHHQPGLDVDHPSGNKSIGYHQSLERTSHSSQSSCAGDSQTQPHRQDAMSSNASGGFQSPKHNQRVEDAIHSPHRQSIEGNVVGQDDAYVQLRRQEQMIKELQSQVTCCLFV